MNLSVTISNPLSIPVSSDVLKKKKEFWKLCQVHAFKVCPGFVLEATCAGKMQHAYMYVCTTTIINTGIACMFSEVRSPKHARYDACCNTFFWLAALHSTSTNRMCYLSYQRACHYNAYPAQNSWQSLEQDTNTKLNTFTDGTTFIKVKTKINYGNISPGFDTICTESNIG